MADKASNRSKREPQSEKPTLLSGGNPQIPKGYGDEPVQAYINAVPGWKQAVCREIDRTITRTVPGVKKAVKWNSPLYGVEQDHYFLSYHCFEHYVKVAFHYGALLDPLPPGLSKQPHVRYLDIREGGEIGEQFADWVRQATGFLARRCEGWGSARCCAASSPVMADGERTKFLPEAAASGWRGAA